MNFMKIAGLAVLEVSDYKNLRAAWRQYGGPGSLVGGWIVEKPLTAAQLQRLPRDLKQRLV